MSEISRDQFAFWTDVPVRWGDVDRLGHVNNVQFFRYSEEARTQWVEQLTQDMDDVWNGGQGPILAEIQCLFIQQLRHPATVSIATRTLRIGNSSLQLLQAYYVGEAPTPVATSHSRIVWFDYAAQRSAPVPELMRERIRKLEVIAPEEA